ncbi:Uncharacterised protein [Bacteroides xylanisolvens]|nr:Uncharacterised protein [Bacteroides xylanisolvens]
MYTHYINHMHLLRDSLISHGHFGGRSYASTPLAVSFAACNGRDPAPDTRCLLPQPARERLGSGDDGARTCCCRHLL